jgi:phosphatidylserine synthase
MKKNVGDLGSFCWLAYMLFLAEMSIRYVRFNVEALQQIAAAVVGATRCTKVLKTHEGTHPAPPLPPS